MSDATSLATMQVAGSPLGGSKVAGRTSKACRACQTAEPIFPFTMAFQPIVDLQEGRIAAHEALVRGPNGEGALHVLNQVTPDNLYAFDQACRTQAIALAARLGMDCRLSINFLPNAVYEPRACIRATLEAAARSGFDPRRLTFEIVETEAIADTAHLLSIISEYRRHGFKIALDDFATGYSGLARLADLKPDIVKLDRTLIRNCDRDPVRQQIVAGMLALGNAVGVEIVIEGVETSGEFEALRDAGARFMQGYYFAKPLFERLCTNAELFPLVAHDQDLRGTLACEVA